MSDCPGCDCRDAEIACLRAEIVSVAPAISGDGGSGATGAAVSGADTRLGRRCRYGQRS